VSRLSRQCGTLNISQSYRPPRPVTGIALLYSAQRLLDLAKVEVLSLTPAQELHIAQIHSREICRCLVSSRQYGVTSHWFLYVHLDTAAFQNSDFCYVFQNCYQSVQFFLSIVVLCGNHRWGDNIKMGFREIICGLNSSAPITAAARSKAWAVFALSMGSWVRISLKAWMFMCVYSMLSCVYVEALRRAYPLSKESYRLRVRSRNWEAVKVQQWTVHPSTII
jgi:hypothetical protein